MNVHIFMAVYIANRPRFFSTTVANAYITRYTILLIGYVIHQ